MNSNCTLPMVDEDLDEVPPITQAEIDRAVYRVNFQPMPRKKQKISITLDPEVVAWFKARAGERGYQTLINAALHEAMQRETLETLLRRVIREELPTESGMAK